MKNIKLLTFTVIFILIGKFNLISQYKFFYADGIKSELKDDIAEFVNNSKIQYAKISEIDSISSLSFIGYEKTKISQWDFVKIDFPSLYAIDTINYERKVRVIEETKKEKRKRRAAERNEFRQWCISNSYKVTLENFPKYYAEYQNVINDTTIYLQYSCLQLCYDKEDYLIHKSSDWNGIYNKHMTYNSLEIIDSVVKKYKNSDNEIFYFVTLGEPNTNRKYIGVASESEFLKKYSEKYANWQEKSREIQNKRIALLKQDSKNWLDSNFNKLFPRDIIYFYNVSYFKKKKYGNRDSVLCHTIAYSNIHPKLISISDFPNNKSSTNYEYELNKFKCFKELNIIELIQSKSIFIDSVFHSPTYFNYDIEFEKNEVLTNVKNGLKFDEIYFKKKLNKDASNFILAEPYFINAKFINNSREIIVLEFNTEKNRFGYNEKRLKITNRNNMTDFEYFSGWEQIKKAFDMRLDKPNFNFVYVEFNKFIVSNNWIPNYQSLKDPLKDLIAKELADEVMNYVITYEKELADNKEDKKQKDLLYKKYGKRYVDAAYKGNIIVGMHEDLTAVVISKFWQVTDRSSWNGGYRIYCKSIFDSSVKLWIHVKNRKVTYVSSN